MSILHATGVAVGPAQAGPHPSRPGEPGRGEAGNMGLRQACEEFEALFFQEILKGLRRTIPEGQSRARSMYQDLLDEQMARLCARRGVGLGELLLSRLEGVQGPEPSAGGATKGFSDAADKEE